MQPPPRKVKPTAALKNIHADQVSKLQAKHQQECDLLEDIRTFFLRKAALEKEYAQGLQKVTTQLLKREFPAQPDLPSEDGLEHKTVCTVWRSILEEADRMAKARLQSAEVYAEKVAEPLKPAKNGKIQTVKKVMPQLNTIQAEVSQCVMDMVKSNKTYTTENGIAHDARQKSIEAEDKLKRKSTGIFQSLAGLQKNAAKLRSRTETSEVKETASRNDYLINLAAANAHHIRFYSTDLPEIMKTMDCDVYEKIQESLTVAGQTAAEIAQTESTSFQTIAVEAAKICRQFSHQCYLFQNPVFTNLVQYQFEPSHEDSCNKVSSDHGAGPELEKEARKWATRTAKETRSIRDYYRQLTLIQNSKTTDKTSDSGSQENATTDPEVKAEEIKQHIRKAETAKLKAEARLEALKTGGVNVDEWISQAQMESLAAEESGLARTPSQLSLRTESSGGHSMDDQEPTYTHYDDDDDFIDDTFNTTGCSRSGRVYPIYCKALYDFEASNYDEMSIKAGEDLELIADGDGEGWIKAKNSVGQEGYIPETYVEQEPTSSNDATTPIAAPEPAIDNVITNSYATTNATNNAAPSSARSSTSSQQSTNAASTGPTSPPDVQSPTSVDFTQDTTSSYSSGDLEVQQTTEVMGSEDQTPVTPALTVVTNVVSDIVWAKALYDYDGQTDEELSFLEGTLIKVLRKDDNGVDDGFWEGECSGRVGVFPSLVVEEIGTITPNDPTSPGSYVDYSIPPPVHITLPTPDGEPPPPPPMVNGEECGDEPLPPPPPVLELDDVNQFETAQDSQPVAPPPLADLDQQIQQKRVRFDTKEEYQQHPSTTASSNQTPTNYSANPHLNGGIDDIEYSLMHADVHRNHHHQRNVQNSQPRRVNGQPSPVLKIKNQREILNNDTYAIPNHHRSNNVTTTGSDNNINNKKTPQQVNTPVSSLSRHQSMPNCNTLDGTPSQPQGSPLPLRSKSMIMPHQQQQQSRLPPVIPPPPQLSPKRQNQQQMNQKNKPPLQPNNSKTRNNGGIGPVANLSSSQNFNDKCLGSPPPERRNISTLPPLASSASNTSGGDRQMTLRLDSTTTRRQPTNFSSPQTSPVKSPTQPLTPTTYFSNPPSPQNPRNQQHYHNRQQQQFDTSPTKTPTQQQMWQHFPPSSPQLQHRQLQKHQPMQPANYHQHNTNIPNGDLRNSTANTHNPPSHPYYQQPISNQTLQQQPPSPQLQRHPHPQQQQQQQYYSSKGQSFSKSSLTRRQDKLPLCFDVDDDWESEEGEESLV